MALDAPMGNKRALLIAVQRVKEDTGLRLTKLPYTHRDATNLADRLKTAYDYKEDDIIVMMDDKQHPSHLWPTHNNILRQINRLVSDASDQSQFFFYYSGHGLQQECPNGTEADGKDEEIVAANGKPILDDILHKHLITPLERVKDSKLFALFDCCHSETMLDLEPGNGPIAWSRKWIISLDKVFKVIATAIAQLLRLCKKCHIAINRCLSIPTQKGSASNGTPDTTFTTDNVVAIKELPLVPASQNLSVICLSACTDSQFAYDDNERRLTLTKCFLDAIEKKPDMSWSELRDDLKERVDEVRERQRGLAEQNAEMNLEPVRIQIQEPRYTTTPHTVGSSSCFMVFYSLRSAGPAPQGGVLIHTHSQEATSRQRSSTHLYTTTHDAHPALL
ncbi:hypothetical protein HYDPIDRAFT_42533 [Hydnomerulius pinastri MD-312]|uniref:Unplaced genomic scaffold scaffold_27, whole genome shotgun sequence n=1 Tax=Hydnomerulius pinastri MD-312 TaxID=994086 RepID=A0A0C9WCD8_9AGAM|nr:hypothetical protein HYDPIDRAFT_42533 [Hydnomerulius pinastri MD-312]